MLRSMTLRTLLTTALLTASVATLHAQAGAGEAQVAAPTLGELRDRVERRYQVLPVQNGIVLMPRYRGSDLQSIELADGTIAIDGAPVTGAELRDRVGGDADDITRLSFMNPDARRVLFGIGAPPVGAETEVAEEAPAPDESAQEQRALDRDPAEEDGGATFISEEGDQVRVGGSVVVPTGKHVDGDVVAVGGSATVDGTVDGEVVAVGGSVNLGPDAVVTGAVTSVGGSVNRAPGAVIEGEVTEVGWFGDFQMRPHFRGFDAFEGVGNVVATISAFAVLALLLSLAFLLGRTPIERMERRISSSPWKAAAVGLVAWILLVPALVLTIVILAVSIIGIPLLLTIPFALLALMIGILLGFAAVARYVGNTAEQHFGWEHENPYTSLLVGLGILMILSLFSAILSIGGGPLGVIAVILAILGWIVQFAAWTMGFGAFLLTRFGTRYQWDDGGPEPSQPGSPAPAPAATEPPTPTEPPAP